MLDHEREELERIANSFFETPDYSEYVKRASLYRAVKARLMLELKVEGESFAGSIHAGLVERSK